jgi:hypothetical protein
MRFKEPKNGTIVWKKRFAFIPVRIGEISVWLEPYYEKRVFVSSYIGTLWLKYQYLPEDSQVQEYLLSKSPLGKALEEK